MTELTGGTGVKTSLIVTVRDDRDGLVALLEALHVQTEMPDEIVVVDGGSRDGTLEVLDRWDEDLAPLRKVVAPSANIAAGRNIAVRTASHDWIVCTDAGCRPVVGWLAALRAAHADADIAAGPFVVDADSDFNLALGCTHYPAIEELDDPSTAVRLAHRLFGRDFRAEHTGGRSMAFSRAAWDQAGGFPEHVYAGEDLAFGAAAIACGYKAKLVPEAIVHWMPRAGWPENAQMFMTYARGDIRTKGRSRHLIRLVAWIGGLILLRRGGRVARAGLLAGASGYMWLPIRRAYHRGLPTTKWWRVPALIALKDISQLAGAFFGLVDAVRGSAQPRPAERVASRSVRSRDRVHCGSSSATRDPTPDRSLSHKRRRA